MPEEHKIQSTFDAVVHSLTDADLMKKKKLYDLCRSLAFDFEEIDKELFKQINCIHKADRSRPYRRVTYLGNKRLKNLSLEAGFKACYPMLKGSSFAKPFENSCVFDLTEPHFSMYFEFIK